MSIKESVRVCLCDVNWQLAHLTTSVNAANSSLTSKHYVSVPALSLKEQEWKKRFKLSWRLKKYSRAGVPVLLSFNSPGGDDQGVSVSWELHGLLHTQTAAVPLLLREPTACNHAPTGTHRQLKNTGRYAAEFARVKLFHRWTNNLLKLLLVSKPHCVGLHWETIVQKLKKMEFMSHWLFIQKHKRRILYLVASWQQS